MQINACFYTLRCLFNFDFLSYFYKFVEIKDTLEDVIEGFEESKAKPARTTNSQELRMLLKDCYKRKTPTDILKKKEDSSDQTTEEEEEVSEIEGMGESDSESTEGSGKRKSNADRGVTNPCKRMKRK